MTSFAALIEEHDVLDSMAQSLTRLFDGKSTNAARAIALRDDIAAVLDTHLLHEDAEVYPQLIACTDHATAETAAEFCVSFRTLAGDWSCYLARWDGASARAQWANFVRDSRVMIGRLRRRIADENALLYPAALRATVITLR